MTLFEKNIMEKMAGVEAPLLGFFRNEFDLRNITPDDFPPSDAEISIGQIYTDSALKDCLQVGFWSSTKGLVKVPFSASGKNQHHSPLGFPTGMAGVTRIEIILNFETLEHMKTKIVFYPEYHTGNSQEAQDYLNTDVMQNDVILLPRWIIMKSKALARRWRDS